jgi:hypothetical protein
MAEQGLYGKLTTDVQPVSTDYWSKLSTASLASCDGSILQVQQAIQSHQLHLTLSSYSVSGNIAFVLVAAAGWLVQLLNQLSAVK